MKKAIFLAVALIALPVLVFAAERTVVVEIFTGTWCPYCPGAARGAEGLAKEHDGQVLIVEYHEGNDVFVNTESGARQSYYGSQAVRGYPAAIFDGVDTVIGGSSTGSMFFTYNAKYNTRRSVTPPLEIKLEKSVDAYMTSGTLTATITNTSSSAVSGTVHFTVTESQIPYTWQNMTVLDFVERAMLPDGQGEAIILTAGQKKVVTREFTIDPSWPNFTNDDNIEFGCFVQSPATKFPSEIYQGVALKFKPTGGVEESEPALWLRVPSVVRKHGSVELSLKKASEVTLALFDAGGRLVATLCEGSLSPGSHSFDLDTRDLAKGAYFLTAVSGGHLEHHKLIVTH